MYCLFFFFKQKTAYEIGLGIPAEPLFRSHVYGEQWIKFTILHELNPLFTINVTMRDIKSKNVYSRVNSKRSEERRVGKECRSRRRRRNQEKANRKQRRKTSAQ